MNIKVLVSNDLTFDQRVRKTCVILQQHGLEIELIGRLMPHSKPCERSYQVTRLRLLFHKGAAFYAMLNIRLFVHLLFRKSDVIWANDLDTLPAAFLISKLKKARLIYDSHEYFTEAAGLKPGSFQKRTWERIERFLFPRLNHVITVNESIASIYREKYGIPVRVVRNAPEYRPDVVSDSPMELPHPLIILQGAFMDKDRGVLEAVEAMKLLPECHLLLIGAGEEWDRAKELIEGTPLEKQVTMLPRLPYAELVKYTRAADVGLSLDKGLHFNYYYSLPNKVFDYIHAGIPVVASPLPEVQQVVEGAGVGELVADWTAVSIAKTIRSVLSKGKEAYKPALQEAAQKYNWENEGKVIVSILRECGVSS